MMKCKKISLYIILLISAFMLSCAHIKKMNTLQPSGQVSRNLTFEVAKIELVTGGEYMLHNVVLDPDKGVVMTDDGGSYTLKNIRSMQYSKHNLRIPGAFVGTVVVPALFAVATGLVLDEDNQLGNYGFIVRLTAVLIGMPAGFYLGDKTGKKVYINWKELDLSQYRNGYSLSCEEPDMLRQKN